MKKSIILLAVAAFASPVPAREPELPRGSINVPDLCHFVAENITETNPAKGTDKVYKTRLFTAAGVDPHKDDPATIGAKMRAWWQANEPKLICNVPHSVVRDGSILKLAVDSSSTDFINDAVRRWKVNLNRIDADGKTVLDFIAEERAINPVGSSRYAVLNRYYVIFSSNGAKHARDLR